MRQKREVKIIGSKKHQERYNLLFVVRYIPYLKIRFSDQLDNPQFVSNVIKPSLINIRQSIQKITIRK